MRFTSVVCSVLMCGLLSSVAMAQQTAEVSVFTPKHRANTQWLTLTGTINAKQDAQLAPLQSGVVAELYVEQGDVVNKGQKLMSLDDALAKLTLDQAEAEVVSAKAEQVEAERLFQELEKLSARQFVAETQKAERRSAVAVAKAQLIKAQAEKARQQEIVRRHTLYAPFAGVIADRNIDVGEWVTQQTLAFNLVEKDYLRLTLAIPQEYYQQLAEQGDVTINIMPDVANAQTITAAISQLVGAANNASRTVTALVDLPAGTPLVVGMSAQTQIALGNADSTAVWLPKAAVKQHPDGGRSVFTVENGKTKRYKVSVIESQNDRIKISGIPENMPVVATGVEFLQSGTSVTTKPVQESDL